MRLFVALEIPLNLRDNLESLIEELRDLAEGPDAKRVRWVRPENLHVTLKFIGEVAAEKLAGIREALSTVPSRRSHF